MAARRAFSVMLALMAGLGAPAAPLAAQAPDWTFLRETGLPWSGWRAWEAPGPRPDSAMLARLGFCPRIAAVARNFHWVDADGDARPDLVYSGWVEKCTEPPEGMLTAIYLNRGDRLVLAFEGSGAIVWMGRPLPGEPVHLLLRSAFGDGPPFSLLTRYVPHWEGGSLSFQEAATFAVPHDARLPEPFAPRPRPVRVGSGGGALHPAPGGDEADAVAEVPAGSRGVELAQARDALGRRWLFVALDAVEVEDLRGLAGGAGARPPALFGWMEAGRVTAVPALHPSPRIDRLDPFQSSP